FDWLYGTTHDDGTPATTQYTIWSDVFRCCRCGERFTLWDVAVDQESGKVAEQFNCPHCGFHGAKTKHTHVDSAFKKVAGKWYLPSEEIRAELLNLVVEDEPSAIEWIRTRLTEHSMTLAELVPPWRKATLTLGNRLAKTLPQLLEENFWCDAATNRWRLPTADERQQMGDERTLRIRRNIQRLREGKLEPLPQDSEIFEWMVFAYHSEFTPQTVKPLQIKAERCTGDMRTSIVHFFLCLPSRDGAAYADRLHLPAWLC